jgi:hypothetical protein
MRAQALLSCAMPCLRFVYALRTHDNAAAKTRPMPIATRTMRVWNAGYFNGAGDKQTRCCDRTNAVATTVGLLPYARIIAKTKSEVFNDDFWRSPQRMQGMQNVVVLC